MEAQTGPRTDPGPAAQAPAAEDLALELIGVVGLVAIGTGLAILARGPVGFDLPGVASGVAGQLSTTFPAALLVAGASALNLAAGAVLVRLGRGVAFASAGDAALGGLVGAVLLDVVLLLALGGSGTFRLPVLLAVHAVILALGLRARPLARRTPAVRPRLPLIGAAFVVFAWSGTLVLQLGSPVVPFIDVLPNHVATVEHLRVFGSWTDLTTTASPIYGPSRTFLGYTALLGAIATLSGLPAALAVSAFIGPATVLVAIGLVRLAGALGRPSVGPWALLTFTLTASFARLTDVRATVLVLPLAAVGLAVLTEAMGPRVDGVAELSAAPGSGAPRSPARSWAWLGAALGAAILVHPVIGSLALATVAVVGIVRGGAVAELGASAIVLGGILALPQAATMLGLAIPSPVALFAAPVAVLAAAGLARAPGFVGAAVIAGRIGGAVGLALCVGVLVFGGERAAAIGALARMAGSVPVIGTVAVAGLIAARRRVATPVALAALFIGLVSAAAVSLVPGDGLLAQSLRFEVPKTLLYWVPVVVALLAALAVDAAWSFRRAWLPVRTGLLIAFVLAAVLPVRPGPIDVFFLGEHPIAETLAIDARDAELGYWKGYPDRRRIVRPDQEALIEALRAEIAAGRIRAETPVLHVAASFQEWASTPLGVFAGVTETTLSPDAETSIHTAGGRLLPIGDLAVALEGRAYPYVVLEPAGLPAGLRDRILGAGYRSLYANERGEVFVAGG